jgi:hypothetical protein
MSLIAYTRTPSGSLGFLFELSDREDDDIRRLFADAA